MAPLALDIECPACGTGNSSDSKFCRQCGHLLRAIAPGDAKKTPAAPLPEPEAVTSPAEIDARRSHQLLDRALSQSERGDLHAALITCRQAVALDPSHAEPHALLATLLERSGDLRGAMSAYERVLRIAPDNALERESLSRLRARVDKAPAFTFNSDELFGSDDDLPSTPPEAPVTSAPVANAPVASAPVASAPVASAPAASAPAASAPATGKSRRDDYSIEARLPPTSAEARALAPQNSAPVVLPAAPIVFDFDGPPADRPTPSLGATMEGETVAGVGAGAPVSSSPMVVPTSNATPSGSAPSLSGAPKIERRTSQRRQVNVPVATQRRTHERRAATTRQGATFSPSVWPVPAPGVRPGLGVAVPTTTPHPVPPLDFSFGTSAPVKTPMWAQMLRGSSFFARTLPLLLVGVLGLGFLSWARSQAVAREATRMADDAVTVVPGTTTTVVQDPSGFGSNTAPGVAVQPAQNATGPGFPITNATSAPAAPATNATGITGAAPIPAAPATNTNRPVSNAPRTGGNGGRTAPVRSNGVPPFPPPLPPAAVPPAPNNNAPLVLPPPQTQGGGTVEPPIRVNSLGTSPLNPGGSPQEGRIRITQGSLSSRPAPAPPRSGTQAAGSERAATTAAATGNTGGAIDNLTRAINSTGADQGFLLQQRAMAFLDRGDSARAIEDFNASINAYQGQLDRGENVASAQAGIRSARSGLNLALSRR